MIGILFQSLLICFAKLALFASVLCGAQLKPEEITAIMKDFEEPGTLAPTGLFLGGTKYMVIQGEPGAVIRGKKVSILHHILLCSYVTDECGFSLVINLCFM